jgi:hypothetical protein
MVPGHEEMGLRVILKQIKVNEKEISTAGLKPVCCLLSAASMTVVPNWKCSNTATGALINFAIIVDANTYPKRQHILNLLHLMVAHAASDLRLRVNCGVPTPSTIRKQFRWAVGALRPK